MGKNSKYPKYNSRIAPKDGIEIIKKMKILCSKCNKTLLFFDFLKIDTKKSDVWESVWFCNNESCNEYKKFKY